MFLPSLARVSCHNQINSLDITKAAQLPKKRDIVLIAPTFVHVSNGGRGMNEGDAMRLRSLLRARRNRPRGQNSNSFNEIAPPHCLPRGSGQGIVPAQTYPGNGPAHYCIDTVIPLRLREASRPTPGPFTFITTPFAFFSSATLPPPTTASAAEPCEYVPTMSVAVRRFSAVPTKSTADAPMVPTLMPPMLS